MSSFTRHLGRLRLCGRSGVFTRRREEIVTNALIARELHLKDRQYVVSDGRVVILDDFTGCIMPALTLSPSLNGTWTIRPGCTNDRVISALGRVMARTPGLTPAGEGRRNKPTTSGNIIVLLNIRRGSLPWCEHTGIVRGST